MQRNQHQNKLLISAGVPNISVSINLALKYYKCYILKVGALPQLQYHQLKQRCCIMMRKIQWKANLKNQQIQEPI